MVRPVWTAHRHAAFLAQADAFVGFGVLFDQPCVLVDLADHDDRVGADDTPAVSANLPAVIVAIDPSGRRHGGADVVVGDLDAAQAVADAVDAHPHAAVTLAQLLRLQAPLEPLDALVAESLAYATLQGGAEFAAWLDTRGTRVRRADDTARVVVARPTDDTLVVTLDRPRLFNLYDARMRDELVAALATAVLDDTVTRIELRGAGRAFCAGGDLAEFGTTRNTARAHLIRTSANVAPLLLALAPRLHAFVHGAAVGAGCELAAFASHVVAGPAATFALPEVAMGLVPGAGGTVSIARRIGRHRAAWLALTGTPIDAPTARAWGLVDELADELA